MQKTKLKSAQKRRKYQLLYAFNCQLGIRIVSSDHEGRAHDRVSGTVIWKAPGSRGDEDEALTPAEFGGSPRARVGRRRMQKGVVVGPGDRVAARDGELGGREDEAGDRDSCRCSALGSRRTALGVRHARSEAGRKQKAESRKPLHFFVSTFARVCSACARCAATAGRMATS